MLEAEAIAEKIRTGLAGAAVEVRDTTGSGDHFEAEVRWSGFAGLSMVKQHQKVYSTRERRGCRPASCTRSR